MKRDQVTQSPKVRTPHGTRVARRVVCTECGNSDVLHFVPRQKERVLCRPCAAKHLGVADPDSGIFPEHDVTCASCGKHETSRHERLEGHLCGDCRAGIVTQQGTRALTGEVVGKGKVVRVRRAVRGDPRSR
jgi:hypothetical protein